MVRGIVLIAAAALLAGCQANAPDGSVSFASHGSAGSVGRSADARVRPVAPTAARKRADTKPTDNKPRAFAASNRSTLRAPASAAQTTSRCGPGGNGSGLAGRTIQVGSIGDIQLRKGEVVLTFDDGPRPATTPKVLAALSSAGVRATFFPVGQMARTYPKLLRDVARRGHTIGHHTDRHAWLSRMKFADAMAEIAKGERVIAKALSGSGASAAPFFRFPYLAHTSALRKALARRGTVVVDVDIDSADYKRSSGAVVRQRTMARLRRKGRGVILFHDIHGRTASMLPGFLRDLKAGGYKVVHLVPRGAGRSSCAGRVG